MGGVGTLLARLWNAPLISLRAGPVLLFSPLGLQLSALLYLAFFKQVTTW